MAASRCLGTCWRAAARRAALDRMSPGDALRSETAQPGRDSVAARLISVIGHPGLLMPVAVFGGAVLRDVPTAAAVAAVGATLAVSACVGGFSLLRVRAGRWRHVDASIPIERSELNLFLILLMVLAAAVLAATGQPPAIAAGLALCGGIVGFGHVLRAWLKVSLHAAFAVLAAALLWPSTLAFGLTLAFAVAVGWSRWQLGRHTAAEVFIGLAAGGVAGVVLNLLAGASPAA